MSFPHVIAANLLESVNSSISSAVIFSSLEGFQVKPCIEKSVHLGNTMDATSSTHKEKICVLRDRALMAALELSV